MAGAALDQIANSRLSKIVYTIGRHRRCELVGHRITGASTSRHGPTTKVRGRVSIVPLDSRIFSKFPSIGYAPSEYRTKPWPQEVLIEGWFPYFAREQNGFRVDGTTDIVTPAPRSLHQRNCGSRHTPLSGNRRIDHPFLTTSIYSRTRVDAGCHNKRIAGRWVIVLLDILFHRTRKKRPFAFTKSHLQNVRYRDANYVHLHVQTIPIGAAEPAEQRAPNRAGWLRRQARTDHPRRRPGAPLNRPNPGYPQILLGSNLRTLSSKPSSVVVLACFTPFYLGNFSISPLVTQVAQ